MYIRVLAFVSTLLAGLAATGAQAQPYGGYGNQQYGEAIDCRSSGYNYQRCEVPWRDARIARQLSDTQCIRGRTWGFDPRGGFVWVDRGCAARFVEGGGGYGGGPGGGGPGYWQPGPEWNQRFSVTCESEGGGNRFCQVDVGGGGRVSLERQLSSTPCYEGRNWGWNRGGVWVSQGCRATFVIDRRWR